MKRPNMPAKAGPTRAELEAELERLRRRLDDRQAQGEMELSRERFVEFYDFAPVGYLTLDHNGRIRTLNLPAAELLGYPRDELVGRPLLPLIARPDRRRFLGHLGRLRGGQAGSATEVELLRRDQPSVTVRVISVARVTDKSLPVEYHTVLVDITERKRAEGALRESEERLRQAAEAAGFGTYAHDFASGQAFYSPQFLALFGLPPGAPLELDVDRVPRAVHPEDKGRLVASFRAANDPRGSGFLDVEFRILLPEGQVRWLRMCGRTVFTGSRATDHPLRTNGITQDVTESKQAAQEREEALGQLRAVLDSIDDGVVVADPGGHLLAINPAALAIHGFESLDQVDRRLPEFEDNFEVSDLGGRPVPIAAWPMSRALRGERFTNYEVRVRRKDVDKAWIASYGGTPVRGKSGEFILAVITIRNITERQRAEERMAALGRLGLLLSAAHEPAVAARALVDTAMESCGWDACFLLVYDSETDTVTALVTMDTIEGRRADVPPLFSGDRPTPLILRVMQEGPQLILRKRPEETGPLTTRFGDTSRASLSLMFVPVRLENQIIGLLSVQSYQRDAYTPQDLAVLQGLANHGAGALARVQAEAALRQLNEELERRVAERTAEVRAASRYARSLIEASLDPLVTISPAGKITDVNEATELLTGVPRGRLIGSDFSSYFTEPDKAEAGYQKVLAEGLVRDYPLTVRHVSGRVTEVLYHVTVYRNEAGEVQGVLASARDITERRQAERRRDFTNKLLALFARKTSAREYLEAAVEAIREWSGCEALGIRLADGQGALPYASCAGFEPAFLEAESGLSLHQDNCCCIRAFKQDFEPQDGPIVTSGGSYRCDDAIGFAGKLPPEQQARYRGACTKFGFASLAVVPVRYREEIIGVLHLADRRPGLFPPGNVEFLETITPLIGDAVRWFETEAMLAEYRDHLEEQVKQRTGELEAANAKLRQEIVQRQVAEDALLHTAEDLKRSNLDLEQFAYVASHDLQEPLRAVGGYVRLLEHRFPEKVDSKTREYIEGAAEGAVRMEQLIMDLLTLSRVSTGGGAFAPANLAAPLNDALRNLEFTIRAAKATVTNDPLPTLPVDESQMLQLFQNLIANALKFHSERPPQIHVGARPEKGRWVLWVRDNGIGMEVQYFERIFQVFQRLHTRKKYPGTGIGLSVCKKIIERHGGKIWVESQPGQGSTFYFSIPEVASTGHRVA